MSFVTWFKAREVNSVVIYTAITNDQWVSECPCSCPSFSLSMCKCNLLTNGVSMPPAMLRPIALCPFAISITDSRPGTMAHVLGSQIDAEMQVERAASDAPRASWIVTNCDDEDVIPSVVSADSPIARAIFCPSPLQQDEDVIPDADDADVNIVSSDAPVCPCSWSNWVWFLLSVKLSLLLLLLLPNGTWVTDEYLRWACWCWWLVNGSVSILDDDTGDDDESIVVELVVKWGGTGEWLWCPCCCWSFCLGVFATIIDRSPSEFFKSEAA